MKVYTGNRTFDGIDVRVDLRTVSRNGFEWSFEGASPEQLAVAILADAVDDATALRLSRPFMTAIVANFGNEWEMTEADVAEAVRALEPT